MMLDVSQINGLPQKLNDIDSTVDLAIDNRTLINQQQTSQDVLVTNAEALALEQSQQRLDITALEARADAINIITDPATGLQYSMFVSGNKVGVIEL